MGPLRVELMELEVVAPAQGHEAVVGLLADRLAVMEMVQDNVDRRPTAGAHPRMGRPVARPPAPPTSPRLQEELPGAGELLHQLLISSLVRVVERGQRVVLRHPGTLPRRAARDRPVSDPTVSRWLVEPSPHLRLGVV